MGRLTFQIERIKAILADDKNYQVDSLKIGAIWDICDRTASYKRGKDISGKDFIEVLPPGQSLSQEAVRDEALEALEEGYAVLADVTNQWEGRHTIAGQKLLCKMRDAIASATGISGEFVQDNATNPLKREPNAAKVQNDSDS